jgi:hypothetical protein
MKVSRSTGWSKVASRERHTEPRASFVVIFDDALMPFPVPSATGFAKTGKGRRTASISEIVSTTTNSGVGMPKS